MKRKSGSLGYEIVVKVGPSEIVYENGSKGLVWRRVQTFCSATLDAARTIKDRECKRDPDAICIIRDAATMAHCG